MKLLKKLLPVAAIASTAAIVAPIVTSCGAGVSYSMYDKDGNFVEYKSVVEQHAAVTEGLDEPTALTEYLKAANENKKLIADDYFVYLSDATKPKTADPIQKIQQDMQFSLKNVDVEKKTVSVTLKMNRKSVTELEDDKTHEKTKMTHIDSGSLVVSNMPFDCSYKGEDSKTGTYKWNFGAWFDDTQAMTQEKNWSVVVKINTKNIEETSLGTTTQNHNSDYTANSESSQNMLEEVRMFINQYLYIQNSHFFAKVAFKTE